MNRPYYHPYSENATPQLLVARPWKGFFDGRNYKVATEMPDVERHIRQCGALKGKYERVECNILNIL